MATVSNEACSACHDGPVHNREQNKQRDTQQCAACHREHRGREVLARIADGECTACHAHLKENSERSRDCPFEEVHSFPAGHPPFRLSLAKGHPVDAAGKDRGQLKFNHHAHLKTEGVRGPDRENVHLQCADCHQPDAAGRYMQPIRYESHCKRCHQLSVQLAGKPDGPEAEKAARAFAATPAPHREPEVVRAVLRDRLVELARQFGVQSGEAGVGRSLPAPHAEEDLTEAQWAWAQKKLTEVEMLPFWSRQEKQGRVLLFDRAGGCAYCHVEKGEKKDGLPVYARTDLPQRWYAHSLFSHERHREVDCKQCHEGVPDSKATADVLLPGMDLCARCHNPHANGGPGARHDCVECHRYHPRDSREIHPRQSIDPLLHP